MLWVQLKNGSVFKFEGGLVNFVAPNYSGALAYAVVIGISQEFGEEVEVARFRADEILSVTETPPLVIGHQCQPAAEFPEPAADAAAT